MMAALLSAAAALVPGPWSSRDLSPADRAARLLANMTLDEKLVLLHGPIGCTSPWSARCAYVGNVAPIERLGIPPLNMNDGPQGFRAQQYPKTSTAWPSGLTMAASWDVEAMEQWGAGMGKEFKAKGSNIQLGPGLCLARVPRNGRNFEYLSGEDPYLGYSLVQPAVKGIQSQGVIANAKHWVLNNQETNRGAVDELASERTRFEMYYPPFAGAIKAGVGSFMCSYNKVNGNWSCENPQTLRGDLKQRLNFSGFVMSDWGATHSTSIAAGLDVEMPGGQYLNNVSVKASLASGNTSSTMVDEAVKRILTPMFAVGVMDAPNGTWDWAKLKANVTSDASAALARQLSAVSTVLLKNDGILPLKIPKHAPKAKPSLVEASDGAEGAEGAAGAGAAERATRTIAVIGFAAEDNAVVHAGGSGEVTPSYIAAPLVGIRHAVGSAASVVYDDGTDHARAAALAAKCDDAIVFVQTLSSEGHDRPSLSLDDNCANAGCQQQNALVFALAHVQPRLVVVMSVPGAVLTPWRHAVGALLLNFMPGQQAGFAIADVLFGSVAPSGKLPLTFPAHANQSALTPHQWPGWPDPNNPTYANYSEGLLVGYRYYDALGLEPAYPFGHGLSYVTFRYTELSIDSTGLGVSFSLANLGCVEAAEVWQLYVTFPPSAKEPPKVLRRFAKVSVQPGKTVSVHTSLTKADLSIWDEGTHDWALVKGHFGIHVGSSSRDIRLSGALDV